MSHLVALTLNWDGESPWSFDVFNVTPIQVPLFLVIVVHCIDNILLTILEMFKSTLGINWEDPTPYLNYPPDGAAKHMPRRQRGDHKSLPLPLQLDRLVVLELSDLLKAGVHFVQSEEVKLFNVMTCLQKASINRYAVMNIHDSTNLQEFQFR